MITNKIRLCIVDDHEVVRHGLKLSLELEPDMLVVAEAGAGADAIALAKAKQPDIVLLDVRLADIDGPEVCQQILTSCPNTSVIMLTSYLNDGLVFRSLMSGAKGYVIKDVELAELKKMIRAVAKGRSVLDPRVAERVISKFKSDPSGGKGGFKLGAAGGLLSDLDLKILGFISEGLTNKEIGQRVNLSPHTVKDHVRRIMEYLDVSTRAAIGAEATKQGLL
ncbi:MAG: response regulator transcription factor [Candidatus Rokubacteria bacterium]|nr:response regulator transcription factor [Candidatus Rokubacteria bacterium]